LFRVYKPKGDRVRAVQVTEETASSIIETFMGEAVWENLPMPSESTDPPQKQLVAVRVPTLAGVLTVAINDWLVRPDMGPFKVMTDAEFTSTYEVARNTSKES